MIGRNAFSGVENVLSKYINKLNIDDLGKLANDLERFRKDQNEMRKNDHLEFTRLIQEYCYSMCEYYTKIYKV